MLMTRREETRKGENEEEREINAETRGEMGWKEEKAK